MVPAFPKLLYYSAVIGVFMKPPAQNLSRYLRRIRIATWGVMVIERLWLLCLPMVLTAAFFAALSWLHVFTILPYAAHVILLALFTLAAFFSLAFLFRFRLPKCQEIDRRIETASSLRFQPLLVQHDKPAGNISPLGQILWREHQRHMAETLENLQIAMPHPNIPRHDAYALRTVIFLLFAIGFAVSRGADSGHLSDAFHFGKQIDADLIRIDAWVTPPRYTNLPPVYLTNKQDDRTDEVKVPQGSRVTVRVANGDWRTRLTLHGKNRKTTLAPEPASNTSGSTPVYEVPLSDSATLRLSTPHFDKSWSFQVMADRPPFIEWIKPPQRAMNGTLELDYKIDDDFGATKSWIEISHTQEPRITRGHSLYTTPEIELVIPRGGKGNGQTIKDLTNHPWAGADVEMKLVVEDGAGQQARSAPVRLTLPQRSFGNPLARAVIEQRRLLAQDTFQRDRISDMLAALLIRPEDTIDNSVHVLALHSLRTRLALVGRYDTLHDEALRDDALRDVVDYMWNIAGGIENGNLPEAEQRLKQVQQALRDALRNGASQEEIERLMNELRQAIENYISMLAQQGKNSQAGNMPDDMQMLGADELEKRLKELENMAKLGNLGAAEQLLAELEKIMNDLQVTSGGSGQARAGSKETTRQGRMQKQMDDLSDMMHRQQQMLNETHRLEDQYQRGETGKDQLREKMNRLQQQQGLLQSQLDRLQKELGKEGLKPGQGLSEAEKFMENAQKAMRNGNGSYATQNQADALDAMRHGAQDLMNQMREAMQKADEGKFDDNVNRDPLGRESQNGSRGLHKNGMEIPGELDVQRARRILDEIRKRLGNLTPQIEKDYLERLLKFD